MEHVGPTESVPALRGGLELDDLWALFQSKPLYEISCFFLCERKIVILYIEAIICYFFGFGIISFCCRVPCKAATSLTELRKAGFA